MDAPRGGAGSRLRRRRWWRRPAQPPPAQQVQQTQGARYRKWQIPGWPLGENRQQYPPRYREQTAPSFLKPGDDQTQEQAAHPQGIELFPAGHSGDWRKTFSEDEGENEQDHQRPQIGRASRRDRL